MEELKTCHQCRQRTTNRMVVCKNLKERKPCTLKFCWRCLLNRYGEKGEEVEQLNDWKCPKCRNNCNCSVCLRRKGNEPVGKLTKALRDEDYSSVADLISVKAEKYLKPTDVGHDATTITLEVAKEYLKPTNAGHDATTTTLDEEIPILPSTRKHESSSKKVLKEKKEMKRKKPKWSLKFKSLRPFVDEKNEMSNEGMDEETVETDKEE